ncbi:NAD-dependent succinate-semialdehyde dehydrogenase [Lichenicola cladoniae]|uniref:NAD-dependent succinate-semialdehyde dehydrogenase n=1 Tax=Lichenicola cladoniae TaxID=1484109 RepID=A0A6M8HHE0_9PROT|nr:NAD-dependent succinate-semialdehyde dehydrogenase [Lichenicola cladoniae]NPD69218.1 NAD-dependent succinate-semialdehyde dehydrogenase [Acetobacteraceae bacterium]QKE89042.1 NAD-dependent succinate-semialdehyde dehydrogenase [Lichenicola cladoniae]
MPTNASIADRSAVSRNPATGKEIERFPFQSPAEIEQVLSSADTAFRIWREQPVADRAAVYARLATTLRDRTDEIAAAITREMGKITREARAEVEKCAATAEWYAKHGPALLADEPTSVEGTDQVHVSYLPIGTILGIMPWNFPLWQTIRAAVPIMLSGNAFVLKHAPNVMRSATMMQEAWEASGLPKGLFGILNVDTDGIEAVIEDGRIAGATLTGSMRAGSAVAALAGKNLKKSVLELGGIDPFIVLADADIDKAVKSAIAGRFSNCGQVCLAAKRFILEAPIADCFIAQFLEIARTLKAGDPLDEATSMGPIARDDLRDGVHDQVERSIASGAELLLGGHKIEGPGFFYEPTVLGGVKPGMAAFDEEVFGPVAAMVIARDAEHAIELANTSDYGLSGNLWTSDTETARRTARRLETGGVFINGFTASNPRTPVGGVKKSGYGRELSHFGLREFTNAQTVWTKAG